MCIRDRLYNKAELTPQYGDMTFENKPMLGFNAGVMYDFYPCLLYTSDAADDLLCVDLGGRRFIKKNK